MKSSAVYFTKLGYWMPKLTSEPLTHEKFGDKEKIRLVIYQDKHCGVKTWCSHTGNINIG